MHKLAIIESALSGVPTLPTAAWDLVSFFSNAKNYGTIIGGGLLSLVGLIIVVFAGIAIAKKLLGGANGAQQDSWLKVVLMLVIGGAMMFGGIAMFVNIAEGGKTTIEELGGGFILLQSYLGR